MKRLHQDPNFQLAHKESLKRLHQNPEFQMANKERMKRLNQDSDFQLAHKKRSSENMKRQHQNPDFKKAHKERVRESLKLLNQNPEFQEKRKKRASEHMTRLHQNPVFAEAHKKRAFEHMRKLRQQPDFIAKQLAGLKAYYSSLPPKLVHKVVGNVNRATNQIIDYADPNQPDMWMKLEQAETRQALMGALNTLKQSNPQAFNAIVGHFKLTDVFSHTQSSQLASVAQSDIEFGLNFLKKHLLNRGIETSYNPS